MAVAVQRQTDHRVAGLPHLRRQRPRPAICRHRRTLRVMLLARVYKIQEGLAVASIARDDPSTLPGDDPFPRAH